MKTTLVCLLLLVAFLASAVSAKYSVVYEPNARSIISKGFGSANAELAECIRSKRSVYRLLNGERAINAKNNREIAMVKKLLALMRLNVHSRHAERKPLITHLENLLKKLLGVRAANLTRIEPLELKYKTLKRHCGDRKRDSSKHGKAIKEIRDAIRNQKKLISKYNTCAASNKACAARRASLKKSIASLRAILAKKVAAYNRLVVQKKHCDKKLSNKKVVVTDQRATNTKLRKDISTVKDNHKDCIVKVDHSGVLHTGCRGRAATCKATKATLNAQLDALKVTGTSCTSTLKQCQAKRLMHIAKCKLTTSKASGLERQLGVCANSLEHCNAKHVTASSLLPKCQKDIATIKNEFTKLFNQHKSWKSELDTFKPVIRTPPKDPFGDLKPNLPSPSATKIACASTGDPHYTNFAKQRFDVYGYYGNYQLLSVPGAIEVETTIQPLTRVWRNRGLNTYLGIRLGNNVIYGRYNRYVANGKTLSLAVGKTHRFADGSSVRRSSSTYFQFIHPSGSYVNVHGASYRGFIYHNIYTGIPVNWVKYAGGLCKSQSRTIAVSRNFLNSVAIRSSTDPRHLIGKSFVAPVVPKGNPFHNFPWKSAALKASAERFCGAKLRGSQYVDCLLDAKISGSITGAQTYNGVANDLKTNAHLEKVTGTTAVGATLREVARMKNLLGASAERMGVLGKHLKNFHDQTLAKDISRLSNRMDVESKFLTSLEGSLTNEVLRK